MNSRSTYVLVFLIFLLSKNLSFAQDGSSLFTTFCATCHVDDPQSRAPTLGTLKQLQPENVLSALEKGSMIKVGAERSRKERIALAEFITGKAYNPSHQDPIGPNAFCDKTHLAVPSKKDSISWNSWGASNENTRFQNAADLTLNLENIQKLKLKWSFGFPGASSASTQPVVNGGRVYVGSWEGDVFSLDMATGCIHWRIEAQAGVRAGLLIDEPSSTVFFADLAANVYAVDAKSGRIVWKSKVETHPLARISGGPKLHNGLLYVPVSSREESMAGDPKYPCCQFRGSIVALEQKTGRQSWKTYLIDQPAQPKGINALGVATYGPSGVAVWNSPAIDTKRNVLYIGTGNSYTSPNASLSDSIVALDLKSGKLIWSQQFTANDMWNGSCPKTAVNHSNCANLDAPDFDFSAPPMIVKTNAGDRIIASQKSGIIYSLDPDQKGQLVWQNKVGIGGTSGGIMFGSAADERTVYAALSDAIRVGNKLDPNSGGGLIALDNSTGQELWRKPHPPCGERKLCSQAQTAAVSVSSSGLIFSGSIDGFLRAYSTRTGEIVWSYDTAISFNTVNGVKAKGGSISDGGVAIVDTMLFTNSGYSHHSGINPGNVFLAFEIERSTLP
jgi:polyvinyl alcohol dehydrogenase (cytochrome)